MNPLQKIKSKIEGKGSNESKRFEKEDLVYAHHLFMKTYGWISLEEFSNLPIPTFFNLLKLIVEEMEKEAAEINKINNKTGKRR